MNKGDFFLITTADERTWDSEKKSLFLGEWCRLYSRREKWERMDALVAPPYGIEAEQKERDLAYSTQLFHQLLGDMAHALNEFHKTNHSVRYWNILLGYWLMRTITTVLNRYKNLEAVLQNYQISYTAFFDDTKYSLAPKNTLDAVLAWNDDIWNNIFSAKILSFMEVKLESKIISHSSECFVLGKEWKRSGQKNSKKELVAFARKLAPLLSRPSDAFIINSYLNKKEELKLQSSLGQVPQSWQSPPLEETPVNPAERRKFIIKGATSNRYELFLRQIMTDLIPTCYLEGYPELCKISQSLNWPKKPKFIYTANNFDFDEIFKTWTGQKVEEGVPYFVGQHGNNYGTHYFFGNQTWPDRSASDKFFSWGWTDNTEKVMPAFNFKLGKETTRPFDPQGGLLLIEKLSPHRMFTQDNYYEYNQYQEEQFNFVEALPVEIQQKLTVKPHSAYKSFRWSDEQRWKDRAPHIFFQTDNTNLWHLTSQSRLIVHSYDSTGILENLTLNIPTICFWSGGHDHLLPQARSYYQLLQEAKIFFATPEEAAEFVTANWETIELWWKDSKVQNARLAFCRMYSRSESSPVEAMKKLFYQALNTTGKG